MTTAAAKRSMRASRASGRFGLVALGVAVVFGIGCSPALRRYDIRGRVTYRGKPVAAGNVSFDPLSGSGSAATPRGIGGGFAHLRDGQYDTAAAGRGHIGGLHRVTVVGLTGAEPPAGMKANDPSGDYATSRPAFARYESTMDLPPRASQLDIDIPDR